MPSLTKSYIQFSNTWSIEINFIRRTFLSLALISQIASAQGQAGFDGSWTVTWEGKRAILEAKLLVSGDSGTWKTSSHEKNNPCAGKEVPIRVDERTSDALRLTLRFSEIIPGCNDSKVSLAMGADGTVSGKRGAAELKLARDK